MIAMPTTAVSMLSAMRPVISAVTALVGLRTTSRHPPVGTVAVTT